MNLMFQPQFEPLIVSGRKPHTIRPKRKIPLKVGQPLSLRVWTGKPYRSPQREFHTATVKRVAQIKIESAFDIWIDGKPLTANGCSTLSWHDGFMCLGDMIRWFASTHALPFEGELIYWNKESLHVPQT